MPSASLKGYEADFRYGLVHVRNNAEAIAFYSGEEPEKKETKRRLGWVVTNYNYLIKWEVIISVLRRSYGYAGNFFPYLMMAPAYLSGEIEYGSFIQAKFAFNMVEGALSFVVSNIDLLAQWWAGVSRLAGFQVNLAKINAKAQKRSPKASKSIYRTVYRLTQSMLKLIKTYLVEGSEKESLLAQQELEGSEKFYSFNSPLYIEKKTTCYKQCLHM